ncbi:MAG: hypothetical protein ISR44_11675 [Rhodospirillales bacterium]|nr:hypothetical protein [Rhodospirillales bacterium]
MKMYRLFHAFIALIMLAGVGNAEAAAKKSMIDDVDDVSLASIPEATFDIFVQARCHGKTAEVKLINKGDRWPDLGEFKIFRADDKSVITGRKLVMAKNQRASFVLQGSFHRGDEIGVFVNPTWTEREFTFDSRITCK